MKENDGRGARRQRSRKLATFGSATLLFLITMWLMSPKGQTHREKGRAMASRLRKKSLPLMNAASQKLARQFRKDLETQYDDSVDEAELLQRALEAKIHLVDLHVVEEELLAAPSKSYAGVYGEFCRLNWKIHKDDPSGGA